MDAIFLNTSPTGSISECCTELCTWTICQFSLPLSPPSLKLPNVFLYTDETLFVGLYVPRFLFICCLTIRRKSSKPYPKPKLRMWRKKKKSPRHKYVKGFTIEQGLIFFFFTLGEKRDSMLNIFRANLKMSLG